VYSNSVLTIAAIPVKFFQSIFNCDTDGSSAGTDRVLVWDGWRGMAILMVLCGHFYDIGGIWEDRMGVDIFFGLSGMLMSVILFEKRMSLRDFYIRRMSRIFPVFFVCVVAMFGVGLVLSVESSWSEFFASLMFLRTYLPAEPGIWDSGPAIAHLWSLNVEEHAYIFLSLMTLFFVDRRFIGIGLLCIAIGLVLFGLYQYSQLQEPEFRLYLIRTESAVVFILFSAGYGLLARHYKISVPHAVPVACIVFALLCYTDAAPLWLVASVSPVLLAFAVNHLSDMPVFLRKVLSNSIVRYFGLWSYSIYLWQQLFFENAWRFPGGKFTAVILAILTGVVSYYFLEQPVRRWINRKWSPKPSYRTAV